MSQDFFDPELITDFILESKEHLETIEPNLLELEKEPDNLALLNEIFRPMHSLKGASGFLALNRINQLAHKSENILDELRKGTMTVTSEIMDVILASTDALRQMIDNLESIQGEGDVPIEHIISQIDAIMRGEITPPLHGSNGPKLTKTVSEPDNMPAGDIDESPYEPDNLLAPSAAAPSGTSQVRAVDRDRTTLSSRDWIANLPGKDTVTLTAFGEGHLKDFVDEARENTENINAGLLELERTPEGNTELVNDLFRFFHNLKGNSGIIDFRELNGLTHEAETLLNRARQGELLISRELVDLLLVVVDTMEALVDCIDPHTGTASPFDASELLAQLQLAVAGGEIVLPASLLQSVEMAAEPEAVPVSASQPSAAAEAVANTHAPLQAAGADRNEDDVDMFRTAVRQQQSIIRASMSALDVDTSRKDMQDSLYRCLVAIQNASSFMEFEDLRLYAERTASLVDQARKSDMDFGLMLSLLSQELSIIDDMVESALLLQQSSPAPSLPIVAESVTMAELESVCDAAVSDIDSAVDTASRLAAELSAALAVTDPVAVTPIISFEETAAGIAAAEALASSAANDLEETEDAPATPSAPARPVAGPAQVSRPAPREEAASSNSPAPSNSPAMAKVAASAGAAPVKSTSSSSIRVDHEKLDHLMNLIGELLINRNRYAMIAKTLETSGPDLDITLVAQDLSETTYAMARVSDELQDTIMKVRMVPVASVFSRFPRLVRDLSRKSGKEVELILEGEETELDKSVVEVINDPLMHLIRNSVDHGIESAEERIAAGKDAVGRVYLRAYHKGNSVAIEIEDDGKGIDPDKMREVAIRKGVITPEEAKNLDDREAVELIFAPGFSSAEKITDISGRGVGMDVVRTNVKNLKGSVNTTSVVGKGTRFTLSLPLTLAIIEALMIKMNDQMYAIPLDAVSTTTKLESVRLTDVKGRKAVTMRGEVLGIVDLAELLNIRPRAIQLPEVLSVVIIQDNERRLGLVVDHLLDRQEIVIKSLGTYLSDVRGLSGASIMGDGSVVLILDPHEIYMMATSKAI